MSSYVTLHDDFMEPEELEMAREEMELLAKLDHLDTLCESVKIIEDPKSSQIARSIAIERAATYIGEQALEYLYDLEKERDTGLTLVGKIFRLVGRLLQTMAEGFFRYMSKLLSLTAKRERQSARLITQINKNIHRYRDQKPKIKLTQTMVPLTSDGKLLDGHSISKLIDGQMSKINPSAMMTKVAAAVGGIPADIESGKDFDAIRNDILKISEIVHGVMKGAYGAQEMTVKGVHRSVVRVPGVNIHLIVQTKPGRVSEARLETKKAKIKSKTQVDGLSPQEAFSAVSTANQAFNRLLDRDDGYRFKKDTNDMIRTIKASSPNDAKKDLVRYIPRWVNFVRQYIKATNDLEYRVALAVLATVEASKKEWSIS
ncbi:hypothetical protein CZP2022_165 [Vibrio phage C-ZP2022]|nr:hypothetical protein CZP2022_165 [Vibrio phage C-ZP2022]